MSMPFPQLRVGNPVRHKAISAFPLFSDSNAGVDYILSEDAISSSSAVVQEVGEHGRVPELMVENKGDSRVLFLEGELLTGAKQDRILNATILIPIAARIKIPVSCVEQGRWAYRSRSFDSSRDYSSSSLRYILKKSVSAFAKTRGVHDSDQGALWEEVAGQQASLGVDSKTFSMSDSFKDHENEVREHQDKLRYMEAATGLAVALGSKLVSVDLFDKSSTCEKAWDRLLSGIILESLGLKDQGGQPAPQDVVDFVERLQRASWVQVPAVGEGKEYRAESEGHQGSALFLEDSLIHFSLLPAR